MILLIFIFGLVVGSFLSAYTWRAPRAKSVKKGRSKCVHCGHEIKCRDNIPLFSYLHLGGKCRHCGKKISLRYPAIELGTALAFTAVFLTQGGFVTPLLITVGLVAVFVTDVEHQIILDEVVFYLVGVVLVSLLISGQSVYLFLFAGLASALFLLSLNIVTSGRGMGLGDVKLAIPLGMSLGPGPALVWLLSSFVVGGITGLLLIAFGGARLKQRIAFGPFMVIGYALTWFYG